MLKVRAGGYPHVLKSGRSWIVFTVGKRAPHTSQTKAILLLCLSMLMMGLRS